MRPNQRFLKKPKSFWASVRTLSQRIGYSKGETLIVPTPGDMVEAFAFLGLNVEKLVSAGRVTELGIELQAYFEYRAEVLANYVRPRLMDAETAKNLFYELQAALQPKCPMPMNKQKGTMKAPAFLTGIVNMLIEKHALGYPCNFDPRELTTVTRDGEPIRTLARRVDGAFPGTVNPIAVWEIKEYYYTTTFGSRVADGVYETLLDGLELEELRDHEGIDVKHYLMIDSYYTWWHCGKSYLCRIIDMVHMGYVDEILFGSEVVDELPRIVDEWVKQANRSR